METPVDLKPRIVKVGLFGSDDPTLTPATFRTASVAVTRPCDRMTWDVTMPIDTGISLAAAPASRIESPASPA